MFTIQNDTIQETLREILVNPAKSPQHYVDRYNNDKSYREWFDRNFVNTTIHEMLNFESVTCSDDKILVFEKRDNSPVCTTDTIASKLLERGWAVSFVR